MIASKTSKTKNNIIEWGLKSPLYFLLVLLDWILSEFWILRIASTRVFLNYLLQLHVKTLVDKHEVWHELILDVELASEEIYERWCALLNDYPCTSR